MNSKILFCCLFFCLATGIVRAEDWPTYRHDNRRSGISSEKIDAGKLKQKWVWRSTHLPVWAWHGPAKWDAYHGRGKTKLGSMRDYDKAFHVSVASGLVYFGSSADDSVHCLNASTGKHKWIYTTDGPIRVAPSIADGKTYFSSDDGKAYCVDAKTGKLIWDYNPAPDARRVLNNGKIISILPCRTGVLVDGGKAYFGASMLPWKETYLCAVDAKTGKIKGKGYYKQQYKDRTMEGPLLIDANTIYTPQGRVAPLRYNRATGKTAGSLGKRGGTFATLTKDSKFYYGQSSKESSIAGFGQATRLIISGNMAYASENNTITAKISTTVTTIKRKKKKTKTTWMKKWKKKGLYPYSLALAGDTLFAGGQNVVIAFNANDGKELWKAGVDGKVYSIAIAGGSVFVSTSEGAVYCFRPGSGISPKAPAEYRFEEAGPNKLAMGPYVEFTDIHSAIVRWEDSGNLTFTDSAVKVVMGTEGKMHKATVTGLRADTVYSYAIGDSKFELDTLFNYSLCSFKKLPNPYKKPGNAAAKAKKIIATAKRDRGVCILLGIENGELAYELAKQSRLRVIGVDTNTKMVDKLRQVFVRKGLYGRITFHSVKSLKKLPFIGNVANIIYSDNKNADQKEARRLLCPGGMALVGGRKFVQSALKGAGVWTHQYGLANNTAYGGEELQGATNVNDLEVQWVGRPGPRYHPDRNGRKPAPLAINGRLFGQGLQRIVAICAYTGSILWSLEVPPFGRFNMPRDSGNWCADKQYIYAAIKDRCWQIDARNGKLVKTYNLPPGTRKEWKYDWSYIADGGNVIIGSAVKQGSAYMNFRGGATMGWYDKADGRVTYKICSESLFVMDKQTGAKKWGYTDGVIINSTITVADGHIFFVTCRNKNITKSGGGRVGSKLLWKDQFLVSVDLKNGKKAWEKPLTIAPGTIMLSMAHSSGKLVIVASTGGKYNTYAFDAANGSDLWKAEIEWNNKKNHHGAHMQRPGIVDNKVYQSKTVLDLNTGENLGITAASSCGTISYAKYASFFRAGNVSMWSFKNKSKSAWSRLRPDCWLSTVPGCGLVLSPEAGGGCWCEKWMETSIVFIPKNYSYEAVPQP